MNQLTNCRFRSLFVWSLAVLALAPIAGIVRPLLKSPFVYWPTLLLGALLGFQLLRKLKFLDTQVIKQKPYRFFAFLIYAAVEFMVASGIPVERFHFLLFGVLGLLALGWSGEVLIALIACGLVATLDESVQLILASRVGDPRDLWLDLRASGAGIFLGGLLGSQARWVRSPRRVLAGLAGLTALLTIFLSESIWGSTISMPGGTFFSSYGAPGLLERAKARDYLRFPAPSSKDNFALKDRYYIEGLGKLQRRNEWVNKGLWRLAAFDNAVLETYYGPILDAHNARWTGAMARQAAQAPPLAPLDSQDGPERGPRLGAGLILAILLALASIFWSRISWICPTSLRPSSSVPARPSPAESP